MKYRITETTLHHAAYEVEADSQEEALTVLKDTFADEGVQVEEFWGETTREVEPVVE